jgi:hypothetical protein
MTLDVRALTGSVREVCPAVVGVSIGDPDDRTTWRIDFVDGATQEERAVAAATLNAYDPHAPTAAMVDAERDRRLASFAFGGRRYDFDSDSQTNMAGAGTLALAAIISGKQPGDLRWADPDRDFGWIALDNTLVSMDAQTTMAFAQAAGHWKSSHIMIGRALKNATPIPADFANDAHWPAP